MPEARQLHYPSYVTPGTVIGHDQSKSDVTEKFIAVDQIYPGTYQGDRPVNLYTVDLRTAGQMEVYDIAKGGHEPRSIVEFYIIRRKWTPYGYAKVWGSTPDCSRPAPEQRGRKPFNLKSIKEMTREIHAKQAKCEAWYKEHRGIEDQPPKDNDWLKTVNRMYREMQETGQP